MHAVCVGLYRKGLCCTLVCGMYLCELAVCKLCLVCMVCLDALCVCTHVCDCSGWLGAGDKG